SDGNVLPAFQGMIFCLLAFVGFEAVAPLGEEAREPLRTIPRAVILSAVLVGLFYVFCWYAATVFFGPDKMTDFYTFNKGDRWGFMADAVLPIGGLLVVLAILNSCLANANAGATAATRSLFAMGRATLLPRWFGAVPPTYKSPINAINFPWVVALVIAVALVFVVADDPFPGSGPLNVYVWLGTMIGLLFAFMYIAVNV